MTTLADQINQEFARLGVGVTNPYSNPYSGLMAEETEYGLRIFDDYADVIVAGADELLKKLQSLDPELINLDNVWMFIG